MYQFIFRNTGDNVNFSGELTVIPDSTWYGKNYIQTDYLSRGYATLDHLLVNYFFLVQLTGQLPFARFFKDGVFIQSSQSLYNAYVHQISTTNRLLAEKSWIP